MMKGVLSYTVTAVDMAQNTRWNRRSFAAAHAMTELVSRGSFTSATTTSMAIADFWFDQVGDIEANWRMASMTTLGQYTPASHLGAAL